MKSDMRTRVREALGTLRIEDAPAGGAVVAAKASPPAKLADKAKINEVLNAAHAAAAYRPPQPEPQPQNVTRLAEIMHAAAYRPPEPEPQPQNLTRRVEIMLTGAVSGAGMVRETLAELRYTLAELQGWLFAQAGETGGRLEARVTVFFDGCRHTTPWSASPVDVGAATTYWHCFDGESRFAEAFAHSANEAEPVDAIIIYGNRFDDHLHQTLGIADRLAKRGTRIFAFHTGRDRQSRRAYEQLAERSGGVFVELTNERAFARVLPVITDYLFRPVEALRAASAAKDREVRALVERLKLQPPPKNSLLLTWRKQ